MTLSELPEPAQQLWNDHGELLVEHLDRLGQGPTIWQLGGGTLLAKEWLHRQSFDLDITIATRVPRIQARDAVTAIARELERRGLTIDDDPQNNLVRANAGDVNRYGHEAGIEIWIHDSGLPAAPRTEEIGARPVPRLSTAQILHGKLQRDRQALTRDAYDIAWARTGNRRALEIAINSLDPNHQRRAEITWAAAADRMNIEPNAILGWNGKPAQDQRDCGVRAAHAIHDVRWIELEITARDGRVYAKTVNTAGEEREWLDETGRPTENATIRLEHAGILLHLQNQYKGTDWKVQDVLTEIEKAAKTRKTERILQTCTADRHDARAPLALLTAEIPAEGPRVRPPRPDHQKIVRGKDRPVGGKANPKREPTTTTTNA